MISTLIGKGVARHAHPVLAHGSSTVHHQFALRMVIQEQQITGTKGCKTGRYTRLPARQSCSIRAGCRVHHQKRGIQRPYAPSHRGISHHPGSGLLTHFLLLFGVNARRRCRIILRISCRDNVVGVLVVASWLVPDKKGISESRRRL